MRLLRVLQESAIQRVGDSRVRNVDIRVIAATNRILKEEVAAGRFRQDLYYRLAVYPVRMPPLRDRCNDVLLLANRFLVRFAERYDRKLEGFTERAEKALRSYAWPGNVRELENVIRRLVVMAEGDAIEVPDLPSVMRFSLARAAGVHRTLAEVEAEHIINVLATVGGNKTRAAEVLGIDRKTLREKLKSLGMSADSGTRNR